MSVTGIRAYRAVHHLSRTFLLSPSYTSYGQHYVFPEKTRERCVAALDGTNGQCPFAFALSKPATNHKFVYVYMDAP